MSPKYKIDISPFFSIFEYALYERRSFIGLWDYWKAVRKSDYISLLLEEYEIRVQLLPIYLPDDNYDDPVNFEIIENIDHIYIVSEDNKERVEKYLKQSAYSTAMSLCDFVLKRYQEDNKNYYQMLKNRKKGIPI